MGLFGGIEKAKFSEGGVYVKHGVFLFEVQALKSIETRTKKDAFVAEFKILESTNPERPVGSLCSWMVMMEKESALGNIKQFLAAMLSKDESLIDEAAAEFAVAKANQAPGGPIHGRRVRCSATDIKTKQNRDFTKCKFFAESDVAGTMKEHAEATRAA